LRGYIFFLGFVFFIYSEFFSQETVVLLNQDKGISEEALIILPGFGDSKKGRKYQKKFFQNKGYDLYIPLYKDGKSLDNCVANLERFYNDHRLHKYKKVHFFSYIVGSWTLNKFIEKNGRGNIASIVYDRSPIQERAPYIANEHLSLIVRLKRLKKIMSEMANTPYNSLKDDSISIGIIIESKATPFMRLFKKKTLKMGPLKWGVSDMNQRYNDNYYTWLNHDQMYTRFDIVGKEVLSFFKYGMFSKDARRNKYNWDPFLSFKKEGLK
tara:strand:+ start:338 stop:1141 length:804 start_codon:yes stop_codon:yes gene_type:complete